MNKEDTVFSEIDSLIKSQPEYIKKISGQLPDGWRVVQMSVRMTFRDPGRIAVFADAEDSRDGHMQGARVVIDPGCDHAKLVDDLASGINKRIRETRPEQTKIRISLSPGATMPTRGSAGASGYDLYAMADVTLRPGQVIVIHSGVSIELPDDTWECQVRGRSSMSKRGLWVSTGTVDSDYRGVCGATVINLTKEDQKIAKGDRYAQLVFARVAHPGIDLVDSLTETERGTGGFGSSGR